jgi:hypothetical protein
LNLWCSLLDNHKIEIKKTHVVFVEFDDIVVSKLAVNRNYFGEGNSLGRKIEFDLEYCLGCSLRLLDGKAIMTKDILEDELERFVVKAKNNNFINSAETTLQHSDFEILQRLIESALKLGKFREKLKK